MKISDTSQLAMNFKVGDIVWGCSFSYNEQNDTIGHLDNQPPIMGILMPCRYEKELDDLNDKQNYISYFVPLKKDGKTPSWKKAIPAYALKYASTQTECEEMYNGIIDANIEWRKNEIAKLRKLKIKPHN